MPEPWWTEADDAELALLVEAFVDGAFQHKAQCVTCSGHGPWCLPVQECFQIVQDWRRGRSLASKAAWLRAQQSLADFHALLPANTVMPVVDSRFKTG